MNKLLREYFTFTRRERNGILVLVLILILFSAGLLFQPIFYSKTTTDFSEFQEEIKAFRLSQTSIIPEKKDFLNKNKELENRTSIDSQQTKKEFFAFDPNSLTQDGWVKLGLTPKQAKTIENYLSKGGVFRKKEDVKKMHTISGELYSSIEPYIKLPQKNLEHDTPSYSKKNSPFPARIQPIPLIIEINSADSAKFEKLRGIGPSLASRIVKYRNRLGGFQNIEQLKEVFGMRPGLVDSVSENLTVDVAGEIKKININTCTVEDLKAHPYLKWSIANAIVAYREKHNNYLSIEDIIKTDLVSDSLYRKLAPYLTTE